jgi:hypothetical protein
VPKPTVQDLLALERAILGFRARLNTDRLPGIKKIYLVSSLFKFVEHNVEYTDLNGKQQNEDLYQFDHEPAGQGLTFHYDESIDIIISETSGFSLYTFKGNTLTGDRPLNRTEDTLHTITHELSHAVFQRGESAPGVPLTKPVAHELAAEFDNEQEWQKRTFWKVVPDGAKNKWVLPVSNDPDAELITAENWKTIATANKPVSQYGVESPHEDMAEAISYYLINPRQVMHFSPIRFQLCQDILANARAKKP